VVADERLSVEDDREEVNGQLRAWTHRCSTGARRSRDPWLVFSGQDRPWEGHDRPQEGI
jgi:hypothetical protein